MDKTEVIRVENWEIEISVPENWSNRQIEKFIRKNIPGGDDYDWDIISKKKCEKHENNVRLVLSA